MDLDRTVWWKRPWVVVLVCVLVCWLAFIITTWEKTRYHPTGDALFDKTAVLLLSEYNRTRPRKNDPISKLLLYLKLRKRGSVHADFPDLSEIRNWEDEFGNDPRYWQLMLKSNMWIDEDTGKPLWERNDEYQDRYVIYFSKLPDVARKPGDFAQIDFHPAYYEDTEQLLGFIDQAIAADPANSFFYYRKGDILAQRGKFDLVTAEYEKGNATENNYIPLGFPGKELVSYQSKLEAPTNQFAAALIYTMFDNQGNAGSFDFWRLENERLRCLILGGDLGLSDVMWKRAQRLGQMDNATPFSQHAAMVLVNTQAEYIPSPLTLSDPTQKLNSWLLGYWKAGQFKNIPPEFKGNIPDPYIELSPAQSMEQQFYLDLYLAVGELHTLSNPQPQVIKDNYSPGMNFKSQSSEAVYREKVWPSSSWSYWKLSRKDLLEIYRSVTQDNQAVEAARPLFDLLDPPPFQIWESGGTTGVVERAKALGLSIEAPAK